MRLTRRSLPGAPEGLAWTLRQRGDIVALRLRTRGIRRKVVAGWSTESFSSLLPDPTTALMDVATQMADSVASDYCVVA